MIGVALPTWSVERLHARVTDSIRRAGGVDSPRGPRDLLAPLTYVSGDYRDPGRLVAIKEASGRLPSTSGTCRAGMRPDPPL